MKKKWIVIAALFHFLEAILFAMMMINTQVELPVPEFFRDLFMDDILTSVTNISVIFGVLAIIGIVLIFRASKKPGTPEEAYELIKTQRTMRFVQLPLYVLLFLVAVFFLIISFFMAGVTLAIALFDILAIILTGLYSIPVYVSLRKNGLISESDAVLYGIFSFIFCIDVVVAVLCCNKVKKRLTA